MNESCPSMQALLSILKSVVNIIFEYNNMEQWNGFQAMIMNVMINRKSGH